MSEPPIDRPDLLPRAGTSPQALDALVALGEQAFVDGDLDLAEQRFREVLRRDASHATALNDLAVLRHARGDLDEAERLFLKAAIFDEAVAGPLVNLAAIAVSRARLVEAARYLERAFEVGGETPEFLEQLTQLSQAMSAQNAARAAPRTPVPYRAAFESLDITPDLQAGPVELQGYFGPPRRASAITSPLALQILLLEDAFGTRALIVAADVFGFGPEMVQAVRHSAEAWGIPHERVVLNASHTHYAPGTVTHAVPGLGVFDRGHALRVCDLIAAALPRLYQALAPCDLAWGRAQAQVGFNRRRRIDGRVQMAPNPEAHYERETPLLQVTLHGSDRRLLMVNHGCHPTGLSNAAVVSAGFPGEMRSALLANGAADVVMFLQGAQGEIKSGRLGPDEQARWINDVEGMRDTGRRLADAVLVALKATLTPITEPIASREVEVVLPIRPGPQGRAALDDPAHAEVPRALLENWAVAAEARYDRNITGLAIEAQVLALGEAAFCCIPAEPMAQTAARIRAFDAGHAVTFVLGCTNGLAAYVPTAEMVDEGGYEAHTSAFVYTLPAPLAAGAEAALLDGLRDGRAHTRPTDRRPQAPGLVPRRHRAFFVMSTGRSGTQTLAHLFENAQNAKVWHHPEPNLIHETLLAYRGALDKRQVFWAGRGGIIRQAWDAGLIHGETDHNMTPFCDVIAEDIPDARFLVLVRDPREFVRSGMRRGYYHPQAAGPWEEARLRPAEDDPTRAAWESTDRFSKVCWLWAQTYRHIQAICGHVDARRVMLLRFEDLVADTRATARLFDFLELDGFDEEQVRGILGQKLNAQQQGDFPHPSQWSAEMHAACWRHVGDVATLYGYAEAYGTAPRPIGHPVTGPA